LARDDPVVDQVSVAILAADGVTREGAAAILSSCPRLTLLTDGDRKAPDVLLVIAGEVTDDALARIEQAGRRGGTLPRVVLVTNRIHSDHLRRAVDAGLASLLRQCDCGSAQILDAVVAAGTGAATVAGPGWLDDDPNPAGAHGVGFDTREVAVLRLLAAGRETADIAQTLNYSDRTVKNVIHGILSRHGLRNRTHAVAYALRSDAL
jgi:DNA-binding NarL/FixJ family response regulator